MRTNIVIDDQLMRDAMQASGARTKREAVEIGLRTLVKLEQQKRIKAFRGRMAWDGDLNSLRQDETAAGTEPSSLSIRRSGLTSSMGSAPLNWSGSMLCWAPALSRLVTSFLWRSCRDSATTGMWPRRDSCSEPCRC